MNTVVVPAKAGTQRLLYERHWAPAFAGATVLRGGALLANFWDVIHA